MEGVSASMYTKIRSYWRRRGYQRLNESGRRRRMNTVELGGGSATTTRGSRRRKMSWRIKIKPKLKIFKRASPKKFFVWLRDAYVNMMLGFANSRVIGPGYGGGGGIATNFGKGPLKEYDEKMIIQIYKSLVAGQGQLVPHDAAAFGSVPRLTAIVE
ncbi:uncharacterized protein LOC8265169 [Ricinus communis]|uniref:Uncharacterized protein n=1 Tax=Ricinus communis TaxID=3988 RepID=B9RNJ2_RICCO|nr:uncharacterized protein LOC8265169 [Ricinus communis]EEF47315.1 conserved hypothetical protein [Ricinus communis]|eukprot:XP_002515331.1 uncharacterized protein LOC8265169 [Ricinus communis]